MGSSWKELEPIDRKELLIAFLTDDWTDAIQAFIPIAEKYGPKVYNYLKSKWQDWVGQRQQKHVSRDDETKGVFAPMSYRPNFRELE